MSFWRKEEKINKVSFLTNMVGATILNMITNEKFECYNCIMKRRGSFELRLENLGNGLYGGSKFNSIEDFFKNGYVIIGWRKVSDFESIARFPEEAKQYLLDRRTQETWNLIMNGVKTNGQTSRRKKEKRYSNKIPKSNMPCY